MVDALRRAFVWGVKHGFALVLGFLVVGVGLTLFQPGPARADEDVDTLKTVALSDVGLSQKLLALEALKTKGGAAATEALAEIAAKGDLQTALAACAQLGRLKTTSSKGELKTLLEDGDLSDEVRVGAAGAIAVHWKDSGDKSYLSGKCDGNDALEAHYEVLRVKVYGEEE